jgi:NADH-quinone oxidoreductase subunit J
MTADHVIFLLAAALTLGSAIAVVTVRNLVHAALALIVSLFGVAIVFVLLQAGFLAAVQVILYIGAIAILIIFAIMLTRRVMEDTGPQINQQWWLAALLSVALFAALIVVLRQVPGLQEAVPPTALDTEAGLRQLGAALVDPNQFMLPFEVASVLLLVALIGSIVIAGDRK